MSKMTWIKHQCIVDWYYRCIDLYHFRSQGCSFLFAGKATAQSTAHGCGSP